MSLIQITPPAQEPVSLSLLKLHLKVDGTDEDMLLTEMLEHARVGIEEILERQLLTATWDEYFDVWPAGAAITLGKSPVQSVTSVTYYDEDGAAAVFPSSSYYLAKAGTPARVVLNVGESWPSVSLRSAEAVIVRYVAGYGTAPEDVPAPIRQALRLLAAHAYQNREPVLVGAVQSVLPYGVWESLMPYRARVGLA